MNELFGFFSSREMKVPVLNERNIGKISEPSRDDSWAMDTDRVDPILYWSRSRNNTSP